MSHRTKLLEYMVEAGKLLPPQTKPDTTENAVEWDTPLEDSPLRAAIRAILDEGQHPLIQPDLLDSLSLLTVLKSRGEFQFLSARRLAMELRSRYFRPLGSLRCGGRWLKAWTSLPTQGLKDVAEILRERAGCPTPPPHPTTLTPFESEVLIWRLRAVGLRHYRPREIAVRLGCHPSAVYAASQSIAKKLGLRGLGDTRAVRGKLMEDPAFS